MYDTSIERIITSELTKISKWIQTNRLCLNAHKTKYIIFNKTLKNSTLDINIGDRTLDQIKEFNFLGLEINANLDWSSHMAMIMIKLNRNIGVIRRLKSMLPNSTLMTLYYSLIHPHLLYMLLAWGYNSQQTDVIQKKHCA